MLSDLRLLVDDLVRDFVDRLGEPARDRALALAVVQYGKDRPFTTVTDVTSAPLGESAHLPLPPGWAMGASQALIVEHPIGCVPARVLPRHTWATAITPVGPVIMLPASSIAGRIYRLTWTSPHQLDEMVDTIPAADREAVAQYAAGILLDQVATLTSGDSSSTIKADSVDHGKSAPNYRKSAADARQRYHDLLGIDLKRTKPASVTVATQLASTYGERRLLVRRGP